MNQDLLNRCNSLAFSNTSTLSESLFQSTLKELTILEQEFGVGNVIGTLSTIWNSDKLLPLCESSKKLKCLPSIIATIGTFYHKAYNGGVERAQAQLMTLWVSMGYKVILFTEEGPNKLDYPYPESVKRIIIPSSGNMHSRIVSLQKEIVSNKIDIFINNAWLNDSIVYECFLAQRLNVAYVNYIHGYFAWPYIYGKGALNHHRILNLCDLILALSESSCIFYQMCGCKTYLLQNPVPEDLKEIDSIAPLTSQHILFVGRLSEEKRPLDAVRVFKRVHQVLPNTILDIVGTGDYTLTQKIEEYCAHNNLTNFVKLHGGKSQSEVNLFFHNTSCLLFTSEMEGYGFVLLEAKAHGVPIVMYNLSYLTLIQDHKGVNLSPLYDLDDMANNIINMLCDSRVLKTLGEESRSSFEAFAQYDLIKVWTDIFSLCSGKLSSSTSHSLTVNDFSPNTYQSIIPELMRSLEKGYQYELENDYIRNFGEKIIRPLRKIKHFPRKMHARAKSIIYSILKNTLSK